jgi:S-adenosylmethionine decarboxylase
MSVFLGYQTTIDFYNCKNPEINSCKFIEDVLLEASKIIGLTVVNTTIHEFSPIGVSGVIVIEESHIAIHTWPEHNYVAIDFFTCNKSFNLTEGISWLKEQFQADHFTSEELTRGNLKTISTYNTTKHEH